MKAKNIKVGDVVEVKEGRKDFNGGDLKRQVGVVTRNWDDGDISMGEGDEYQTVKAKDLRRPVLEVGDTVKVLDLEKSPEDLTRPMDVQVGEVYVIAELGGVFDSVLLDAPRTGVIASAWVLKPDLQLLRKASEAPPEVPVLEIGDTVKVLDLVDSTEALGPPHNVKAGKEYVIKQLDGMDDSVHLTVPGPPSRYLSWVLQSDLQLVRKASETPPEPEVVQVQKGDRVRLKPGTRSVYSGKVTPEVGTLEGTPENDSVCHPGILFDDGEYLAVRPEDILEVVTEEVVQVKQGDRVRIKLDAEVVVPFIPIPDSRVGIVENLAKGGEGDRLHGIRFDNDAYVAIRREDILEVVTEEVAPEPEFKVGDKARVLPGEGAYGIPSRAAVQILSTDSHGAHVVWVEEGNTGPAYVSYLNLNRLEKLSD